MKCGTIRLGQGLRLVMTPQLRQAINILQISLPKGTKGSG
ncbi:MAG: hypothetical protein ACREQN_11885 [Candidatus Binataceae bacterium]